MSQAREASQADLGIHTVTGGRDLHKAILRQDLHAAAKALLPNESRLQACFALIREESHAVGLEFDLNNGKGRLTNVCRCGNPHICPNCGPIESEAKNQELRADLAAWELAGFTAVAATFTLQHFKPEPLEQTDGRLQLAFRRMWNNATGRAFKARWQMSGRRKSPDVTITTENGWHPHYHVLFFLERRVLDPAELAEFEADLAKMWQKSCKNAGGFADLEHGVRIKADHIFEIADYITSKTSGLISDVQAERAAERMGSEQWGITEELTKSHLKEGRREGLSPNQLLLQYVWGEERSGKQWQEYAKVFKGKKFLDTTPGLRKRLEALKEAYAAELQLLRDQGELDQEPEWHGLAYLGPLAFKQVVKFGIQQWLLFELRESGGDPRPVKEFLDDWGIYQVFYPDLDPEYPDWWLAGPDPEPGAVAAIREFNDFVKQFNKDG